MLSVKLLGHASYNGSNSPILLMYSKNCTHTHEYRLRRGWRISKYFWFSLPALLKYNTMHFEGSILMCCCGKQNKYSQPICKFDQLNLISRHAPLCRIVYFVFQTSKSDKKKNIGIRNFIFKQHNAKYYGKDK